MPNSCFLRAFEQEMARFTDAPPIYLRASALTTFAALLTKQRYRCVLGVGVPHRWTNLWTILVGDSGSDHKSTAIEMAAAVARKIDSDLFAPNMMSPEGFLMHLRARETNGDASGFFVQSEMLNLLLQFQRSYSSALKPILMEFYDVPTSWKRALIRQVIEVKKPRVSLLGGIATELLSKFATPEDWLGGLFSRSMIITGEKTRLQKEEPSFDTEEISSRFAAQLRACLRIWRISQIKAKRPLFKFSAAAQKVVSQLPPPPEEYVRMVSFARASTHLSKVAAVEQVDEDPTALEIGKAATERAMVYIQQWLQDAPKIIDTCYTNSRDDFEGDRLAKRIVRYLGKQGGRCRRSQLLKNCGLHAKQLEDALQSLYQAELISFDEAGYGEGGVFIVLKSTSVNKTSA